MCNICKFNVNLKNWKGGGGGGGGEKVGQPPKF